MQRVLIPQENVSVSNEEYRWKRKLSLTLNEDKGTYDVVMQWNTNDEKVLMMGRGTLICT